MREVHVYTANQDKKNPGIADSKASALSSRSHSCHWGWGERVRGSVEENLVPRKRMDQRGPSSRLLNTPACVGAGDGSA